MCALSQAESEKIVKNDEKGKKKMTFKCPWQEKKKVKGKIIHFYKKTKNERNMN